MKSEKKRDKNKRYRQKHGAEELRRQREVYSQNPQKKNRQSKEYYEANQSVLSKASRERAQAKKNDSDANLELYNKDISFGPEFVCDCCHKGLFENQVLEFNGMRKGQIKPDILDRSCLKPENNSYP